MTDASSVPRVSVIVPVLNEARRITRQLDALSGVRTIHETLVVDGGSDDGTVDLVRRAHSQVRLLCGTPKGRASQMNAGARAASGDVLLFLHADVRLPEDAVYWIREALSDPRAVAGAFRTWTVADAGDDSSAADGAPWLHLADVRSRYTSLPYGDQALFVRARAFWQAGGFPSQPLMEDLELSRRLRRLGRIRTVPARVEVSGRRFMERPFYFTFLVNVFPLLYRSGISSETLARYYAHVR